MRRHKCLGLLVGKFVSPGALITLPGTVMIPQYRFNKTKQHTHTSSLVCAENERPNS